MSLTNLTMRGVVWEGSPFNVSILNLPVPAIQTPTDALVRVTVAGICGTDLHTYRGHYGSSTPPWPMGHEAIGYIVDIGEGVSRRAIGDYVVVSDVIDDGTLHMEPTPVTPFGMGPERGNLGGCQSEYVLVPHADENLILLPSTQNGTSRARELDYLFVSDIFATAWTGLDFSGFEPGDTVAVFGAGPVGLLAAYSATLRGASRVYIVDQVTERLSLAESFGAIPINFLETDPAVEILSRERNGVTRSVECVGYEAVNREQEMDSGLVIRQMVNVTAIGGGIGIVGIYTRVEETEGTPLGGGINGNISFDIASFFRKGLTMRGGGVDPRLVAPELVQLIGSGKANLSFIVTSEVGIEDAQEAYARFNQHAEAKVVIRFP